MLMGYFGWLWMLVFWVGFIWFIVWLVNRGKEHEMPEDTLQILKLRYAKGELSKKQFEEMKRDLSK
jgi:putative membrane protein